MVWPATLHAVVATIFIATNSNLCQKTDTNDDNDQNRIPITTDDETSKVDPLPSAIFKQPLIDLLSPEIFSQSNPLDYILTKALELSEDDIRTTNLDVKYHLDLKRFSQRYFPYAKVLSSLLPCLMKLKHVKLSIIEIQNIAEFSYPPLRYDVPDIRFAALFSRDVFADDNLPSVILHKLLDIPEDKITPATIWFQKLLKSDNHFSQVYHRYINELFTFLDGNARYELKRLRSRLAVLQRTISTFNTTSPDQPKKFQTNVILCQKTDINNDDHQDLASIPSNENLKPEPLSPVIFKRPLTDLLSPQIFSQPNPLYHILTKATELSPFVLQRLNLSIKYYLEMEKFPGPYISYAKVLSSIVPCLIFLQHVKSSIIEIQDVEEFNHLPPPSDIPPPDNRFLALFLEEIFEDDNPPSIVLLVLLHLPEEKDDEAVIWLKKLLDSKSGFTKNYRKYIKHLHYFLSGFAKYEFNKLRRYIAELRHKISTSNSSNSNQPEV